MDHGDNPCWGGCKSYQHDLEYLLHVLGSPSLSSSTTSSSSSSSSTAAAAQISSTTMMHMTTSSESTAIATDQSRVASANSITIDAASAASSSSAIHDNNDGKNGSLVVNLNPLSKRASSPFHFSTPEEEHSSFFHRIHSKLILYHDDQYIVLNKPPDLRMDGPYKATVHKLLLYLFPPPSLVVLLSFGARKNTDCNTFEYRSNSNSKLGNGNENDEQYPATSILQKQQQYHNQLLHSIYPLSSHSSLPDDPFRLVHQLDYATSGVLLIGKTRKATAAACKAFEERRTTKKYVAVVTNHHSNFLNTRSTTPTSDDSPPLGQEFFDNLPILNSSSLNAWSDGSLELQYRKKRQRETNTVKYLPIHSVFDKWRSILIRKKKEREVRGEDGVTTTPRSQSRDSHVNDVRPTALPPPLPIPKVTLTCEEEEELLSLGTSWKSVKSNILALGGEGGGRGGGDGSDNVKNKWIDIIETMTMEYNQSLGVYYAEQKLLVDGNEDNGNMVSTPSSSQPSLPPMFRISSADDRVNNNDNTSADDDSNNTFYICAPIGEIKGRFHVIVDPSISLSKRDRVMISSMDSNVGGKDSTTTALPPLRPALTKCTVLTRGYYSSSSSHGSNDKQRRIPVAKVLLQPWTGRRHQLRVHLANIVGCPILGDVAYDGSGDVADPTAPDKNNSHESRIANNDKERRLECKRMCLHAKELTIPLIGGVSRTFIASDPFVFEEERLVIL